MQSLLNGYFNWVTRRPWLALLLSTLLVLASGYGVVDFKSSNDPRSFFSHDDPDYQRFEELEVKYGTQDLALVIIDPPTDDVFTPRYLQLLEELTDAFWQMPHVTRVQSLNNFPSTVVTEDSLETDFLVRSAAELSADDVRRVKQISLQEPTLVDSLVSESGHVAAIAATVLMDEQRSEAPEITEWARERLKQFQQDYPEVDFYLTGTVVFTSTMGQATQDGFKTTLPIGVLAAVIALILLLRSFLGMLYSVVVVLASVLSAIGLSVMLGIVFQPVSSYASVIIFTLGIADCIHILMSHQQQLSQGKAKIDALMESLRINFQPVLLTSVTTAVGFICLNTSESPPLRDLGNITAIGVMVAFILSLMLLPALIMIFPNPDIKQSDSWFQTRMDRLAEFLVKRYRPVLWISLVIMVALSLFIPKNRFNDVWSEYFDDSFDVRVASDFASDNLSGFQRLEFSFPAQDQGGVSEPEYLKMLDAFNDWAEQQPEVSYAASYSDVIKRLNRDMNGGDPAFYKIPDSRELASQYLLMYELSLPFGLGLDNQMTMNKDETLFAIVLYQLSSSQVLDFSNRAQAWVDSNFPDYMKAKSSGLDKLFAEIGLRNSISMVSGTLLALFLISFMIMLALRSFRYGMLSLLPNMLPALMAFGVWGLIDGDISLSVSIVACITLGVVVDDTVHFLSKYVRAKREQNLNTPDAVRYAFRTVGVALVATSIILVANFGVIATSGFKPASSLGLLTAITIFLALVVDFFFFAPLLLAIDKNKNRNSDK